MAAFTLLHNIHILLMSYCVALNSTKPGIRSTWSKSRRQHFEFLAVAHSKCCNKAASTPLCHIVLMARTVPVATRSFQRKTRDITAIGQTNVSCWSVPQLHNKFPVIQQAHRRISLSGFLT